MKINHRGLLLLISTFVILGISLIAESLYFGDIEHRIRTKRFNTILAAKEKVMEDCLKGLSEILDRGESYGSISETNIFSLAEKNKITILQYIDDKLVHWSDNDFDVPLAFHNDSLFAGPIIFLQNGWFIPGIIRTGNEKFIGLLRVRTDHGFENDIIRNGFEEDFRIPDDVGFSTEKDESGFNVYNSEGRFVFSLKFPENKSNTIFILVPLVLWTLFFILIILLSLRIVRLLVAGRKNIAGLIICFIIFMLLYASLLLLDKPAVIFSTALFSHYMFSLNSFIPSLGHLLFLSVLTAIFFWIFYKRFPLGLFRKEKPSGGYLKMILLNGGAALMISLLHLLYGRLVSGSNISFETYKVLTISFFTVAGYSAMVLFYVAPVVLIMKSCQAGNRAGFKVLLIPALISLLIPVFFFRLDPGSFLPPALLYAALVIITGIISVKGYGVFTILVLFSVIISLNSLFIVTKFSGSKTTENLKIQALSFSTENDPVAEHMLLDIWDLIESDTTLDDLMDVDIFGQDDFDNISSYLQENYLAGYWGNFNINIFLCRREESIRVGANDTNIENCFGFFDDRITKYGHRITGTGFYFIDNQAGRSYYLGRLFFERDNGFPNGLFIELYSDVNVFQPGYYELLIDKRYRGYAGLKDYSFAKYINGKIVIRSGDFAYNKADEEYILRDSEYRIFRENKFDHILYKNGNTTVIISRPVLNAGNILISFAYLFAFILGFSNFMLLLTRRPKVKKVRNFSFKQKLQAAFIGILLFSFLLIGIVAAILTTGEYKSRHYENIREKLNSVYMELDAMLSEESYLTSEWSSGTGISLNEKLINMSNIFNTDINLYDLQGFLMATSRPEIYSRDLASRRMNMMALINVADLTRSEYFHREKIGRLEYVSVYVPFYNIENQVIAWLNLPYFRMQSILAREISNMIVVVINFTLLLVLITMGLAVFISGRLTSPLSMLSGGLASVELGKKSEHLYYRGNDEIGELVKQYNRMLDELEESVDKLAGSEREYAWREMAKQIAHEIKNPLTPMKLNVQQLLKSWKDGAAGFESKLGLFARNQIEYIDNLSSIASAFSSFARMPGTNPVETDLLEQIRTTLELFKNSGNIKFDVQWPHESKIFIFADRDHLNGIFSNLFKNSIQAIPDDREGLISVVPEVVRNKVTVTVSDNGTGIPEAVQKKLFTPNFTTKSSGMGLGLSIVKKYVEGAGGRIWFESQADTGTTFHLEFPLKYTVEKPGELFRE